MAAEHMQQKVDNPESTSHGAKRRSPDLRLINGGPFQYDSLEAGRHDFRLIEVEAGTDKDLVCCTMCPMNFFLYPKYETISCVWGNPDTRGTIRVNNKMTTVPVNTANALRRVRLPNKDRVYQTQVKV